MNRHYIRCPSTPRCIIPHSKQQVSAESGIFFSACSHKYIFFKLVTDLKTSRKRYTTTWLHFAPWGRRLIVVWNIVWLWASPIDLVQLNVFLQRIWLHSIHPMPTLYALSYVKKVFGKSCYRIKVYNEILEMIDVHWFPVCILSGLSINMYVLTVIFIMVYIWNNSNRGKKISSIVFVSRTPLNVTLSCDMNNKIIFSWLIDVFIIILTLYWHWLVMGVINNRNVKQ